MTTMLPFQRADVRAVVRDGTRAVQSVCVSRPSCSGHIQVTRACTQCDCQTRAEPSVIVPLQGMVADNSPDEGTAS